MANVFFPVRPHRNSGGAGPTEGGRCGTSTRFLLLATVTRPLHRHQQRYGLIWTRMVAAQGLGARFGSLMQFPQREIPFCSLLFETCHHDESDIVAEPIFRTSRFCFTSDFCEGQVRHRAICRPRRMERLDSRVETVTGDRHGCIDTMLLLPDAGAALPLPR
jgi:hypothetical protein